MSDTKKTKQAVVLRDFTDAGTGESFTASTKPVPIEEGAFGNYKAAGLVVDPDEKAKPAA